MRATSLLFSLLIVATALPSVAADPAEVEKVDLEARSLAEKQRRLNEVNDAFGKYRTIRDQAFFGANGVQTKIDNWLGRYKGWIDGWKSIVELSRSASPEDSREFSKSLLGIFHKQELRLAEMKSEMSGIQWQLDTAIESLSGIQDFPPDYLENYGPLLESVNRYKTDLKSRLVALRQTLSERLVDKWKAAGETLQILVDLRLKKSALQFPELAEAIQLVESQFAAAAVLAPLQAEIKQLSLEVERAMGESRVFAARTKLAALKKKQKEALETIRSSHVDVLFREPVIQVINADVLKVESQVSQTSAVPPVRFVATYYKVSGAKYKALCSDSAKSQQINCALYKAIYRLPSDQLKALSPPELEELEKKVEQIGKGPMS